MSNDATVLAAVQELVETKWETTMIPMADEEPQHTGEPRHPRFRIALTSAFADWLHQNIASAAWGQSVSPEEQQAVQRIREVLVFQTDLVEQLLDRRQYLHLLGTIAETHEMRAFLVQAGLPRYLATTAPRVSQHPSTEQPDYMHSWLWVLNNHIYYIADDDLHPDIVVGVAQQLPPSRADFRRIRTIYALQILERIALRQTPAARKVLAPVLQSVAEFCRKQLLVPPQHSFRRGGAVQKVFSYRCCMTVSALAFNNPSQEENWTKLPREIMFGYNLLCPLTEETVERLSSHVEEPSRRHLCRTGHLRPGESLHLYLGMCASPNQQLRMLGGTALSVVLAALHPRVAFGLPPVNASVASSPIYAEEALKGRLYWTIARLRSLGYGGNTARDDDLLERHREQWQQHRRRSHSLLAETVLCLANDEQNEVRKVGRIAQRLLPRDVQQQVVWNPAIHAYFSPRSKQIVMHGLLMARRTTAKRDPDKPSLPVLSPDIWITYILPFACVAVEHNAFL